MEKNPADEQAQQPQEESTLAELYKKKGLQKQSYNDYLLLKKQQSQRKKFKLPAPIKFILATPLILLFCIGIIFIPYMLYLFFTS